ncbi:SRPBCC family protein [Klenkia brasiliensis]|uniref:Polyketide cyclase / dehydrase and lipid transport n=1 Tax=Klenkia brasiliensis TaxID=333142 RepID=A0A1G8ABB0_9ACTN|nr:SRPBCC family protein [Klenkia brasiliensis]SDH18254.1 Polyketide cyclase / dehydrase and lipid transport [Klenkia brasiliensis]
MGTITVSSETAFGQPADQVYAFVSDPRNWTKVYPGEADIAGVDRLPLQVGDTWLEGSAPAVFTWRLITAVPDQKFVFQSVGLLGHDPDIENSGFQGLMTIAYTFTSPGEGVTLFHRQMSLEVPKRAVLPEGMIAVFEPRHIDSYHDAVAQELSRSHV